MEYRLTVPDEFTDEVEASFPPDGAQVALAHFLYDGWLSHKQEMVDVEQENVARDKLIAATSRMQVALHLDKPANPQPGDAQPANTQ